jgi:hypothetical protein
MNLNLEKQGGDSDNRSFDRTDTRIHSEKERSVLWFVVALRGVAFYRGPAPRFAFFATTGKPRGGLSTKH